MRKPDWRQGKSQFKSLFDFLVVAKPVTAVAVPALPWFSRRHACFHEARPTFLCVLIVLADSLITLNLWKVGKYLICCSNFLVLGNHFWWTWNPAQWCIPRRVWTATWEDWCILQWGQWWEICSQSSSCRFGAWHNGFCSIWSLWSNLQAWQLCVWPVWSRKQLGQGTLHWGSWIGRLCSGCCQERSWRMWLSSGVYCLM